MNRIFTILTVISLPLIATNGWSQELGGTESTGSNILGQQYKLQSPFQPSVSGESDAEDADSEDKAEEADTTEKPEEKKPEVAQEEKPKEEEKLKEKKEDAKPEEEEFKPVNQAEVEESAFDQILPGKLHPRIEFHGYFRARSDVFSNYDLDTFGTSSILPVFDSIGATPADEKKKVAISANMRMHLEPTLFITDELRIHSELDFLDNVVLGDAPEGKALPRPIRPEFNQPIVNTSQFSLANAIKIRELYGVVDSLFGSLYVGRMDSHFGLGIQDNSGDCIDCDYGSSVDKAMVSTRFFGITGSFSYEFPDEGISTQTYVGNIGQPYDLAQVDDVDQFTFRFDYAPKTEEDFILQRRRLQHDGLPDFNAALQFRWRKQKGSYSTSPTNTPNFPNVLPPLVYKGLKTYSFDTWVKMLYNPNDSLFIRLELEGFVNFGSIDNVSEQPVGQATNTKQAVNCFDDSSSERCTQTIDGKSLSRKFVQWGVALESEFRIGNIASWGLNIGAASGGSTPNWGLSGPLPDYDYAQFSRDYNIDLILFRKVIGTVTNAAYFKPYFHAEFLKSGTRYIDADLSAIFSFAVNKNGTPSGKRLLGAEIDAGAHYVLKDQLRAGLEGGILFPFSGLDAVLGRPRLQRFDSRSLDFAEDHRAALAWTIQGKIVWMF